MFLYYNSGTGRRDYQPMREERRRPCAVSCAVRRRSYVVVVVVVGEGVGVFVFVSRLSAKRRAGRRQ